MQISDDKVVEPFGEINIFPGKPGFNRIRGTVLCPPSVENASVALAIDASRSMVDNFGGSGLSRIFKKENQVELVARVMANYLANFAGDGKVSLSYWACGVGGSEVVDLGRIDANQADTKSFAPPNNMGTGTRLAPAVKHLTEGSFKNAKWSLSVFVTDGVIDDLEDIKAYTWDIARQISKGERGFTKLVLIGLGASCDEGQMEILDDLLDDSGLLDPAGNEIDIWDHSMAADMKSLDAIFKEVVTKDMIIAPSAILTDDRGVPVKSDIPFSDGLPAIFEFELPSGSKSFTLELPDGQKIVQPLA